MSLTANGKATSTSSTTKAHTQTQTLIRRARLTDGSQIGHIATYHNNSPLTALLSPHRQKYYADYKRGYIQRATARLLSPRNITYVAYPVNQPEKLVGYAQFERLGDDPGAWKVIHDVGALKRPALFILSWVYWAYCKIFAWAVGGDKSEDAEEVKRFNEAVELREQEIWDAVEERRDRWHVESVVVLKEWQRQGIGKRLMKEVLVRAEREGVPVGLEASREGEMLYRSVGFELLSRFGEREHEREGGGGVMMWAPEGWKERFGGEKGSKE